MGGLDYGPDGPPPRWVLWLVGTSVAIALAALLLALLGCTERTQYGECWGVAEAQDPHLVYSIDVGNVVIGAVFAETVVVPVWTAADMLKCPTGRK